MIDYDKLSPEEILKELDSHISVDIDRLRGLSNLYMAYFNEFRYAEAEKLIGDIFKTSIMVFSSFRGHGWDWVPFEWKEKKVSIYRSCNKSQDPHPG